MSENKTLRLSLTKQEYDSLKSGKIKEIIVPCNTEWRKKLSSPGLSDYDDVIITTHDLEFEEKIICKYICCQVVDIFSETTQKNVLSFKIIIGKPRLIYE